MLHETLRDEFMLAPEEEPAAHRPWLRKILRDFFHIDDENLLSDIESELRFRHLPAGAVLFRQSESAGDFYFVVSGRLRALYADERGQASVLGEIARGETVGELAVMTGGTRSATVIAVRDSLAARMGQATFERILAKRPKIGTTMMRTVVERFRSAREARKATRPANICLLPITDGIDVDGFTARFAALWQEYAGPIAPVSRRDFERDGAMQRTGDGLAAAEAKGESVLLIADQGSSPWSQRCIRQADEIFLLARADAHPEVSEVEARRLDAATPQPIARQTLVLPTKRTPAARRAPPAGSIGGRSRVISTCDRPSSGTCGA